MHHMKATLSCACGVVIAASLALGTGVAGEWAEAARAVPPLAGHDVFSVVAADGDSGTLYVIGNDAAQTDQANHDGKVTEISAGKRDLPWDVRVRYSLDGPDVPRNQIAGVSGMVGIHITVTSAGDVENPHVDASDGVLVAFSIPARVSSDVNASHGARVQAQGSSTVVSATLAAGMTLDCYMTAKDFAMGALVAASANGAEELASAAVGLADAVGQGGGASTHQGLIDKLTALRDLERSLAASEIAAKQTAYEQAFQDYMAAYVRSYASHLSGSIGSSTQLTALMGTAGELSGDTPLAAAVMGEASAVDELNAAKRHTGAADAIDQVIRLVRQQGVDGLSEELKRKAGEERTQGAKGYADGQAQMSQAMIPYSMAYTDAFTKHLSELTGGASAASSGQIQQAIEATNREFDSSADLADDTAKVDAALAVMAAASERSGAGDAYEQIVLRFANDLADTGAGDGSDGDPSGFKEDVGRSASPVAAARTGLAEDDSLAAKAETVRLRKQAQSERTASAASSGDVTTSVIDPNAGKSDAGEVMKFAGGVPGASNSKGTDASKESDAETHDGNAGASAQDASSHEETSTDGKSSAPKVVELPSMSYGMAGKADRTLIKPDVSELLNDTADLADGGALVAAALAADSMAGQTAESSRNNGSTRIFLVMPGL